ncbi:hypothetical protein [Muricoccus vinaceus]|uniref:Uncharacterized protein n=1 Tax=Muricoccus vinaceus TaxID=424704 RepID=A0ABV6IQS4_9PROT
MIRRRWHLSRHRGLAQAFLLQDPFEQEVHCVGLENITDLLRSAGYRESLRLSVTRSS